MKFVSLVFLVVLMNAQSVLADDHDGGPGKAGEPAVDMVSSWITDLNSPIYAERARGERNLELRLEDRTHAAATLRALQRALTPEISLEQRRRLESLIARPAVSWPSTLGVVRSTAENSPVVQRTYQAVSGLRQSIAGNAGVVQVAQLMRQIGEENAAAINEIFQELVGLEKTDPRYQAIMNRIQMEKRAGEARLAAAQPQVAAALRQALAAAGATAVGELQWRENADQLAKGSQLTGLVRINGNVYQIGANLYGVSLSPRTQRPDGSYVVENAVVPRGYLTTAQVVGLGGDPANVPSLQFPVGSLHAGFYFGENGPMYTPTSGYWASEFSAQARRQLSAVFNAHAAAINTGIPDLSPKVALDALMQRQFDF